MGSDSLHKLVSQFDHLSVEELSLDGNLLLKLSVSLDEVLEVKLVNDCLGDLLLVGLLEGGDELLVSLWMGLLVLDQHAVKGDP